MAASNNLDLTSDSTTRALTQPLHNLSLNGSTIATATALDPSDTSAARNNGRKSSYTVVYAGTTLALPSKYGYLKAFPAEVFDLILNDMFVETFQYGKNSSGARNALCALAQTNTAMRHMIQLELTHFFGRWANERLKDGHSWARISEIYCWVRGRSLAWDV